MAITAAYVAPHPPLIIPQVGIGREQEIARTCSAYDEIARSIAEQRPETIVIISPHGPLYSDYFHINPAGIIRGDFSAYGADLSLEAPCDTELVQALEAFCTQSVLPAGTQGARDEGADHGVLIPLYFINRYYTGYKVVILSPSGLPREEHYLLGMLLRATVNQLDRKTVVIASGDLSHKLLEEGPYGFAPEGPELDRELTAIMQNGRFDKLLALDPDLCNRGAECGYLPFVVLAGALDGQAVESELLAESYGVATSLALDPVEKKPLRRFFPGSRILSVGGYGCNMRCPYCQNHAIAAEQAPGEFLSPEELLRLDLAAQERGSIGVAFTYNEPLIAWEYLRDAAALLRAHNRQVVLVTNGLINPEPWEALLPLVDAVNIDLKAFDDAAYGRLGGDLATVKEAISAAAGRCHLEVTALLAPGFADHPMVIDAMARWLADIDPHIPLHLSRFFPRHRMAEDQPTPVDLVQRCAEIAGRYLGHVYPGNL